MNLSKIKLQTSEMRFFYKCWRSQ